MMDQSDEEKMVGREDDEGNERGETAGNKIKGVRQSSDDKGITEKHDEKNSMNSLIFMAHCMKCTASFSFVIKIRMLVNFVVRVSSIA